MAIVVEEQEPELDSLVLTLEIVRDALKVRAETMEEVERLKRAELILTKMIVGRMGR